MAPVMSKNEELTDEGGRCKIIVNYLPPHVFESQLMMLFSSWNPVSASVVRRIRSDRAGLTRTNVHWRDESVSCGYAFVEFRSQEDADEAIRKTNGLWMGFNTIEVSKARPHDVEHSNTKLCVEQIPEDWSVEDLEEIFGQHGPVINASLLPGIRRNKSRTAGFVSFDTQSSAVAAQLHTDRKPWNTRQHELRVKLAENPSTKRPLSDCVKLAVKFSAKRPLSDLRNHLNKKCRLQ